MRPVPVEQGCAGSILRERDPKRIAIDESKIFAFGDGDTATLKVELVGALGPEHAGRLVSAERLAVGWLEKRTAAELEFYARLAAMNRAVAAEALSAKVIKPGVTTLDDLSWWTRERFAALGAEAWSQPTFYILRRTCASSEEAERNVIRPGDIVRCDIGFRCLGLTTDIQEVAYILRLRRSSSRGQGQFDDRAWREASPDGTQRRRENNAL